VRRDCDIKSVYLARQTKHSNLLLYRVAWANGTVCPGPSLSRAVSDSLLYGIMLTLLLLLLLRAASSS